MDDKYRVLREIIELCLSLDLTACATYHQFASQCKILSLAFEWQLRSKEEKKHILFWEKALALSKRQQLPLVFENPLEIRGKLKKIQKTINRMFPKLKVYNAPAEELSFAFFIENYMLDPVFMTMFHAYRFIDGTIEDEYEAHLLAFMDMAKNYRSQLDSLNIELFNETLHDLYVSNRALLRDAMHDSLTGLYNRRGFFDNAGLLLSLAERKKLDVAVIIIDFDDFKGINDTFGHQAGDDALKGSAAMITSVLRASCLSARYGGDEFIVLADIDNEESLKLICERIRETVDRESKKTFGTCFTVSLGAAAGGIDREREISLAEIICKADKKLFEAKKNGGNCWVI
ncbi:MAG: GGDEF domain-containing protein [Victivallaceae bacterium]|nr:GGDEF domain-containing protein [Victivallaceae bacterium]